MQGSRYRVRVDTLLDELVVEGARSCINGVDQQHSWQRGNAATEVNAGAIEAPLMATRGIAGNAEVQRTAWRGAACITMGWRRARPVGVWVHQRWGTTGVCQGPQGVEL